MGPAEVDSDGNEMVFGTGLRPEGPNGYTSIIAEPIPRHWNETGNCMHHDEIKRTPATDHAHAHEGRPIIGQILFGIVIAQVYIYFKCYQRDPWWVKVFVFVLFVCDICSIFLLLIVLLNPFILSLMTCATRIFFARRIHIITESVWLSGLICFLGGTIEFLRVETLADTTTLKPIAMCWLLSATVGDVMITVILTWSLRQKRSGVKRTD
ncbi:hypothetical protein C8Q72DRAFT_888608 [Fomitopsis betulina]|nr:hypothetical protein C8Q72DRAFT_888608 [Fomitopsis betulina]